MLVKWYKITHKSYAVTISAKLIKGLARDMHSGMGLGSVKKSAKIRSYVHKDGGIIAKLNLKSFEFGMSLFCMPVDLARFKTLQVVSAHAIRPKEYQS